MLGRKNRAQMDLFITGSLEKLIPEDRILARVNRVPSSRAFVCIGGIPVVSCAHVQPVEQSVDNPSCGT